MKQDTRVNVDPAAQAGLRRGWAASVVLLTLVLVLGTAVGAWAFLYGGRDMLAEVTAQDPDDAEAVAGLDLDAPVAYIANRFGPARTVVDACSLAPCPDPEQAGLTLSVYENSTVTLRALTRGEELHAYLLTTTRDSYAPDVRWLRRPLGQLGDSSSAEMLDAMGPSVHPADIAVTAGAPAASYVDVVPIGAPGNYRGVILAWSPDGAGESFDDAAAAELAAAGEGGLPQEALDRFRLGTTPNTVGHFRDKGPVGAWLHEASTVQALLLTRPGF